MKTKLIFCVSGIALALVTAGSLRADDCACNAPDNSCSCSVSCPDGWAAVCTSGNCQCCCVGRHPCPLSAGISLQISDAPVSTVTRLLSQMTGAKIEVLSGGDEHVSLTLRNVTLYRALRSMLSIEGVELAFEGRKLAKDKASPDEEISVCLHDAEVATVLDLIGMATGSDFNSRDVPQGKVTLTMKASLRDVLKQLSLLAHTDIQLASQ